MKLMSIAILFVGGIPLALSLALAENGHSLIAGCVAIGAASILWVSGLLFGAEMPTRDPDA
jgi:hypothetical protein